MMHLGTDAEDLDAAVADAVASAPEAPLPAAGQRLGSA